MKYFMALTGVELKRMAKNILFILAFAMSILMLLSSQLHIIQNYPMNTQADFEKLRGNKDKAILLDYKGQQENFYNEMLIQVSGEPISQTEQDQFMQDLMNRIDGKEVLSVAQVDAIQKQMSEKHEWINRYNSYGWISGTYSHAWFTEDADFPELKEYIASTGQSFMFSFSRAYSQSAALLFSIAFICFFAFLMQRDAKTASRELLLSKPLSPSYIFFSKMLSAFVLCLFTIAFVTIISLVLLYVNGTVATGMDILTMALFICIYTIPPIVFFMGLAVMLTVVTKTGFTVIPVWALTLILSMQQSSDFKGRTAPNLFVTIVLMDMTSFYMPVENSRVAAEIINRIIVFALGLLMLAFSRAAWSRTKVQSESKVRTLIQAVKTGILNKKNSSQRRTKPESQSLRKPSSFVLMNTKICTSIFFTACAVILLLSNIVLQPIYAVTQIGELILANTGWAAIAMFANIFAVEYSTGTSDSLFLAKRKASTVWAVRVGITTVFMYILIVAVFLIGLFPAARNGLNPQTIFTSLMEISVAAMACALFLGLIAATIANIFHNGWVGLSVALLIQILFTRTAESESIFNIYVYNIHYSIVENHSNMWWQSALFYTLLSLMLFALNCFIVNRNKPFRIRLLKGLKGVS